MHLLPSRENRLSTRKISPHTVTLPLSWLMLSRRTGVSRTALPIKTVIVSGSTGRPVMSKVTRMVCLSPMMGPRRELRRLPSPLPPEYGAGAAEAEGLEGGGGLPASGGRA